MAGNKAKGGAASKPAATPPASGKPGTSAPPAATPPAAADPKKRNFLSPQKALAIQLAGLVALLSLDKIAALLTENQKAQVKTANEMADELNSQTIKPVQNRIAVIKTELATLTTPEKLAEAGTVPKVQTLANELSRLQKRLETFTGAAAATV